MFLSTNNYDYILHYWKLGKVAFITTGLGYSDTYVYQIQETLLRQTDVSNYYSDYFKNKNN